MRNSYEDQRVDQAPADITRLVLEVQSCMRRLHFFHKVDFFICLFCSTVAIKRSTSNSAACWQVAHKVSGLCYNVKQYIE